MKLGLARRARTTSKRSGAILLLFALLTFVFFAIAGIVIDVGLANLAQAQMQVAVDSAAIEGCRWRNFHEELGLSHQWKRRKAAGIVRLTFDDDLHPTLGENWPGSPTGATTGPDDADAYNLTAGALLRVSGGTGAWAANAVVGLHEDSEAGRLDDPRLQFNTGNALYGDMVSGTFLQGDRPNETATYQRDDFQSSTNATAVRSALSFLVRMRRSGDANTLDDVTGVSSSLPTVPIVFGLGSTIRQADGDDWDPRRDGITVRATAIASARPAMRVGRPPCNATGGPIYDHEPGTQTAPDDQREPVTGVLPFYLTRDAWMRHFRDEAWQASVQIELDSPESPALVEVGADGSIHLVYPTAEFPASVAVGHFMLGAISGPSSPCDFEAGWPDVVGKAVAPITTTPVRGFRFTETKPTYIAIVESIPDANNILVPRVIGYVFAQVREFPDTGALEFSGSGQFLISAGFGITWGSVPVWVAQDNASAILNSALDEVAGPVLSAQEWSKVLAWSNVLAYSPGNVAPLDPLSFQPDLTHIHDYTYVQRGTVLAPALTR